LFSGKGEGKGRFGRRARYHVLSAAAVRSLNRRRQKGFKFNA